MEPVYSQKPFIKREHGSYTMNQEQLDKYCCLMCNGIAYKPSQCAKCERIYCEEHVEPGMRCKKCHDKEKKWKSSLEMPQKVRAELIDLKLRCDCREEVFRYTEYIGHMDACKKKQKELGHNVKVFYLVDKNNKKTNVSVRQNYLLNINMDHGQKCFTLDMRTFDLTKLTRTQYCLKTNKTIIQSLVYQRASKNHALNPIWTADLPENKFTLYQQNVRILIEKGYQAYLKDNKKSKMQATINGGVKIINFTQLLQINPHTNFTRRILRTVM